MGRACPPTCASRLTNAGTALNGGRHIDRDAIFRLKQEALEALFAGFHGERRLRVVLRRRGTGADRLRDLRGARRAAREGLAALARGLPPPRRRRHRGLPRQRGRAHPLPRLDAVADRRPARARVARHRGRPRPADRARRRGRRRVVLAGHDGARRVGRRARRRVQRQRPGLGPHPLHPGAPARGALPAVHRDHPRDAAARGRPAHRPRHGAVPAVLDSARAGREGRRLRPLARRRAAGDRRAREPARAGVHHRRGPGDRRGGRARAAGRAADAVVPPAVLRAGAAAGVPRAGAVERDDPRSADDRGAVDGRRSRRR